MSDASLLCNEEAAVVDVVSSDAGSRSSDHPCYLLPDASAVDRLFDSELQYMPRPDYLRRLLNRPDDLAARQDSINWILKVHARYRFKPVTAILCINYFDRFLSTHSIVGNGWPFQLLSVACLSLASKMEETHVPLILDLQLFEPNFVFQPKTLQRMELLVMANLNWKLLSVTPFDFIHYFSSKLNYSALQPDPLTHLLSTSSDLVLKMTRVMDFLSYSPSIIAAAAVISAAGELTDMPEMFYERVNKETVRSCHQLLAKYLSDTCPSSEALVESRIPLSPSGVLDTAANTSCGTSSSQVEPPNKRVRLSAEFTGRANVAKLAPVD